MEEELGAAIRDLAFLAAVENIFHIDGRLGHEIVFLYVGLLDPFPAPSDAVLTEMDGSTVPVVWRAINDERELLPLYPSATEEWVRSLVDQRAAR